MRSSLSAGYQELDDDAASSQLGVLTSDLNNSKIRIDSQELSRLIRGRQKLLMSNLDLVKKKFGLPSKDFTPQLVEALVTILSESDCAMQYLYLNGNNIEDHDLVSIISADKTKTLKTLSLSGNIFKSAAVAALSDMLSHHECTIEILILNGVKISDDLFVQFSQSITTNRSLKVIDLSANLISEAGYEALLSIISSNQSLSEIDLSGNKDVSKAMQRKIATALASNKKLLDIKLSGSILSDVKSLIDSVLERNKLAAEQDFSDSGDHEADVVPIRTTSRQDEDEASSNLLEGDTSKEKNKSVKTIKKDEKANDFYIKFQLLFIAILKLAQEEDVVVSGQSIIYRNIALRIRGLPGVEDFSKLLKVINGSDQEIEYLVEYIARQAALNEVVKKYRNRLHPRCDALSNDACVMTKAVTDIARILVELILKDNAQTEHSDVINKDLGDKLCEMLFIEINKREQDYIKARRFGVVVDSSRSARVGSFVEISSHRIAGPSVVINIEDRPSRSPSNSKVASVNGCIIL
jgi:hypothetical protein